MQKIARMRKPLPGVPHPGWFLLPFLLLLLFCYGYVGGKIQLSAAASSTPRNGGVIMTAAEAAEEDPVIMEFANPDLARLAAEVALPPARCVDKHLTDIERRALAGDIVSSYEESVQAACGADIPDNTQPRPQLLGSSMYGGPLVPTSLTGAIVHHPVSAGVGPEPLFASLETLPAALENAVARGMGATVVLVLQNATAAQREAVIQMYTKPPAQLPLVVWDRDALPSFAARLGPAYIAARLDADLEFVLPTKTVRVFTRASDDDEETPAMGLRVMPRLVRATRMRIADIDHGRTAPASLDLRAHKCMPPVRNQGRCGSCWAIALADAAAFAECAVYHNDNPPYSPQMLVDCDSYAGGCNGGTFEEGTQYMYESGIPHEHCVPYIGTRGVCRSSCLSNNNGPFDGLARASTPYGESICLDSRGRPVTTTAQCDIGQTILAMKRALQQTGVLLVGFRVLDDFISWGRRTDPCTSVYVPNPSVYTRRVEMHAVLLVGYETDTRTGQTIWIIRNSWGSQWGCDGYFKVIAGHQWLLFEQYAFRLPVLPETPDPT